MDELLGKKVPFSAQAEQAVIGSILIDPGCVPNVLEKLRADEFYGKLNRDIYDTVYHMFAYGLTIDPVTVLDQMRIRGVYQDNCEQYLADVMRMTPTAANVLEYAAIVRDRALLRRKSTALFMRAAAKRIPRWRLRRGRYTHSAREEMSVACSRSLLLCSRSLTSLLRSRVPAAKFPAFQPAFPIWTG